MPRAKNPNAPARRQTARRRREVAGWYESDIQPNRATPRRGRRNTTRQSPAVILETKIKPEKVDTPAVTKQKSRGTIMVESDSEGEDEVEEIQRILMQHKVLELNLSSQPGTSSLLDTPTTNNQKRSVYESNRKGFNRKREENIMELVNDIVATDVECINQEAEDRHKRAVERVEVISLLDDTIYSSDVQIDDCIVLNDSACIIPDSPNDAARKNLQSPLAQTEQNQPNQSSKQQDCPVCLEPLAGADVSATVCGHVFCTPCITSAVRFQKRCPACRSHLSLKKIFALYLQFN